MSIAVALVVRIPDQPGAQRVDNLAHSVVDGQLGVEAELAADFIEGDSDVANVTAESQVLVGHVGLWQALDDQPDDLILGVVAVRAAQVVDLAAHFFLRCLQADEIPRTTSATCTKERE